MCICLYTCLYAFVTEGHRLCTFNKVCDYDCRVYEWFRIIDIYIYIYIYMSVYICIYIYVYECECVYVYVHVFDTEAMRLVIAHAL